MVDAPVTTYVGEKKRPKQKGQKKQAKTILEFDDCKK